MPASPQRVVRGLFLPAVAHLPCQVLPIVNSAAAISDTLGGVLLDELVVRVANDILATWYVTDRTADHPADPAHTTDPLPDNPRAALLAARLGVLDRAAQARLRGPVLVVGSHPLTGADTDVPATVLVAARRAGITVTGRLRPTAPTPGAAGRRAPHRIHGP